MMRKLIYEIRFLFLHFFQISKPKLTFLFLYSLSFSLVSPFNKIIIKVLTTKGFEDLIRILFHKFSFLRNL